jgi:hypothetical protein
MIEPFLEGLTLSQAITDKRLFIIDLDILEGISLVDGFVVSSQKSAPWLYLLLQTP